MFLHLVFLSITCFLFFLFVVWKKNSQLLPPGPSGWGMLCNFFPLGRNNHIMFADLARTYGELMSIRLGPKLIVIASSATAASQVLKTHDRLLKGKYIPAVASKIPYILESSIVFGINSDTWTFLRNISHAQLFSARAVALQAKLREEKVNHMVNYLRLRENKVVKIDGLLFSTVVNILSNMLVSRDLVDFEDEIETGTLQMFLEQLMETLSSPGLGDVHGKLDGLDIWSKRKAAKVCEKMRFLWQDIVGERRDSRERNGKGPNPDLLDVFIDKSFHDEKIYILLSEMVLGGIESSQVTTQWLMAELLRNEEYMGKLRQELAVFKEAIDEKNLCELPYLEACIKETLRVHHPGPLMIPHCALETCQVMGYTIPKDTLILANQWAIGRNPLIWDEPLKFKPERFLGSNREFRGNCDEFMPFSAGRRICPGLPVAVKQVSVLLASLVHHFDWVLPHGMDPREISLDEKYGLLCVSRTRYFSYQQLETSFDLAAPNPIIIYIYFYIFMCVF